LARFDPVPECVVHEAELRGVLNDPRLRRIEARLAFAGLGILKEPLPVPDPAADVEFVVQNASAALVIAGDGREAPSPASIPRTGDALGIQGSCDGARAQAIGVTLEDPDDRHGFLGHDVEVTSRKLAVRLELAQGPVAIAAPTGRLAAAHATFKSAMCLMCEVLQEEGRHGTAEADVHLVDFALGLGHDRHIEEAHALVQGRDMLLVARQPIERLRDNDVELAVHCGLLHRLEAGPQV
jgi:hypothetical protein